MVHLWKLKILQSLDELIKCFANQQQVLKVYLNIQNVIIFVLGMKEYCLEIVSLVLLFFCFVNFWVIIKYFQILLLGWVEKHLMSSYKLCKILSFQNRAKYVLFEISDSKLLESLVLSCSSNIQNILSYWVSG